MVEWFATKLRNVAHLCHDYDFLPREFEFLDGITEDDFGLSIRVDLMKRDEISPR